LNGKSICWEPHPLLVGIRNELLGLTAKYHAIELSETLSHSQKLVQVEGLRLAWCSIWDHNRTLALHDGLTFPAVGVPISPNLKYFGPSKLSSNTISPNADTLEFNSS